MDLPLVATAAAVHSAVWRGGAMPGDGPVSIANEGHTEYENGDAPAGGAKGGFHTRTLSFTDMAR